MSDVLANRSQSETVGQIDRAAWIKRCADLASLAALSCRGSHDRYIQDFSERVDEAVLELAPSLRAQAIELATRWDYMPAQQRTAPGLPAA